jgi:CMP-N,N'-diacetyllegionaminic acid synthase
MNILFTVCGRAGSKGFKNKNLKELLGKPLVYYTMTAIEGYIKRYGNSDSIHCCLNTDSQTLINLVLKKDVSYFVINRDSDLAGDTVAKVAVIKDSLKKSDAHYDIHHDIVVDLDITSPLRTIEDIHNVIEKKQQNRTLDIVFSVTRSRRNPYFNMVKQNADGTVSKVIESHYTARQQAPVIYDMNASIYAYEARFLKTNQSNMLFDGRCGIVEMFDTAVLDIDSEEDFKMMEVIAEHIFKERLEYKQIFYE